MKRMGKRTILLFLTAVFLLTAAALAGRHYDRRYVRISHLEGNVVFRNEADTDWVAGSVNTPLQEVDRVYVPLNSRVEIEFDDGSYLRLAEDSEVRILNLEEKMIRVEMPIGLATLRFSGRIMFEIRSPSGMVRLEDDGLYRVEVTKDGSLDLAVHKGKAEIFRGTEKLRIKRNQAIYLPSDPVRETTYREVDREDAWDSWNDRRDAVVLASSSSRYLSPDVRIGVTPLDHFGVWVHLGGEYGYGWSPVGIGYDWSPYRDGRWVHRPYWGWTWVSYEPWGWLPYHHGRWYYHPSHRWCWLPGQSMNFHFWSPGVVHFYRHSNRVHWLPLGPHDQYNHNNYYYNVHNITHNTYIQNINSRQALSRRDIPSENIHVQGAMVSVDRENLTNGRPFEFRRVPSQEIAGLKNPVSSLRDIDLQPTAGSLSPRPQITAENLNLTDLRRNPSLSQKMENKTSLRPSIRQIDSSSASSLRDQDGGTSLRRSADSSVQADSGIRTSDSVTFREPAVNSVGRRQIADSNSRMIYEPPQSMEISKQRDGDSGSANRNPGESLTNLRSSSAAQSNPGSTRRRFEGNYESNSSGTTRDISPREEISPSSGADSRVYEPRRRSVVEPSGRETSPSVRRDMDNSTSGTLPNRESTGNPSGTRRVSPPSVPAPDTSSTRRDFSGREPVSGSATPRTYSGPTEARSRRSMEVAPSSSPSLFPGNTGSRSVTTDRAPALSSRPSSPAALSSGSGRRDVWISPPPSPSPPSSSVGSGNSGSGPGRQNTPSRRPDKP